MDSWGNCACIQCPTAAYNSAHPSLTASHLFSLLPHFPCQPILPSTAVQRSVILPSSPFQLEIPPSPTRPSSSHLSAINHQLNTDHQLPRQHHQLRQPAVYPGLLFIAHFGNVLLNLAHRQPMSITLLSVTQEYAIGWSPIRTVLYTPRAFTHRLHACP